jgi:A/G-specific adenine glycosylase
MVMDTHVELTVQQCRAFRRKVYDYFRRHGRDLPWRHTADPWHIVVSEIMLQQTQVDRVIEPYRRFVGRFPEPAALASSSQKEVLAAWKGLGYNRRALYLHRCARMLTERFDGAVPDDPVVLRTLPGIGEATACSIAAFAFNRPTVFIETNIRSVYLHHFFPGQEGISDRELLPLIARSLDRRNPARWYSALMDYGVRLKKRVPNPSRRSAHHFRQSAFQGSDRQIRGGIIRELLGKPTRGAAELAAALEVETQRVESNLERLRDEGFVRCDRGRYRLR